VLIVQTLLRVWDCFLVEGPKVLFRVSMAILKLHQEALISQPDTPSVMRYLKSCTNLLFDADGLLKVCWDKGSEEENKRPQRAENRPL